MSTHAVFFEPSGDWSIGFSGMLECRAAPERGSTGEHGVLVSGPSVLVLATGPGDSKEEIKIHVCAAAVSWAENGRARALSAWVPMPVASQHETVRLDFEFDWSREGLRWRVVRIGTWEMTPRSLRKEVETSDGKHETSEQALSADETASGWGWVMDALRIARVWTSARRDGDVDAARELGDHFGKMGIRFKPSWRLQRTRRGRNVRVRFRSARGCAHHGVEFECWMAESTPVGNSAGVVIGEAFVGIASSAKIVIEQQFVEPVAENGEFEPRVVPASHRRTRINVCFDSTSSLDACDPLGVWNASLSDEFAAWLRRLAEPRKAFAFMPHFHGYGSAKAIEREDRRGASWQYVRYYDAPLLLTASPAQPGTGTYHTDIPHEWGSLVGPGVLQPGPRVDPFPNDEGGRGGVGEMSRKGVQIEVRAEFPCLIGYRRRVPEVWCQIGPVARGEAGLERWAWNASKSKSGETEDPWRLLGETTLMLWSWRQIAKGEPGTGDELHKDTAVLRLDEMEFALSRTAAAMDGAKGVADEQREHWGTMWGTVVRGERSPHGGETTAPGHAVPAIAFGAKEIWIHLDEAVPFVPTYGSRDASTRILAKVYVDKFSSRLVIDETFNERRLRTLSAQWMRDGDEKVAPANYRLLVFSPTPLFYGMLDGAFALDPLAEVSNQLGTFSLRDGWSLYRVTEGSQREKGPAVLDTLILPAQVVGEEVERGMGGPDAGSIDLRKGERADFLLSPPARVGFALSLQDTNYKSPSWRLSRFLDASGEELPGVHVRRLNFDLLYGLRCEIDRSKEPTPSLRIAELFARAGTPVGVWQTTFPKRSEERINAHLDAREDRPLLRHWRDWNEHTRRRLGVLQVYDDRQSRREGVRIQDGLTWTVRHERLLDVDATEATHGNPPADIKIAGGAFIGIESRAVLGAVVGEKNDEHPTSTTGWVEDLHLSMLGAWGKQRVEFDNGRTIIESVTEMGRVSGYKVTRLGRIGVLHNKARHVVVYERTVSPNERYTMGGATQFVQDEHLGRAVLRKVDEYVEVIPGARAYPDRPEKADAPERNAFVVGSEFGEKEAAKFRVEAEWGSDLLIPRTGIAPIRVGWKIPIWRTYREQGASEADLAFNAADPSRARVHRKPQVRLLKKTTRPGGQPDECVHDEPNKLYFATLTKHPTEGTEYGEKDSDKWPEIPGVDYPDIPMCDPGENEPAMSEIDPDGVLPDAEEVAPGMDLFTWAVRPTAHPVELTHGRASDPLVAVVRNITMSRAVPRTLTDGQRASVDPVHQKIRGAASAFKKMVEEARDAAHMTESEIRSRVQTAITEAKNKVSGGEYASGDITLLKTAFNLSDGHVAVDWKKRIDDAGERIKSWKEEAEKTVDAILSDKGVEKQIKAIEKAAADQRDKLLRELKTQLADRAQMMIRPIAPLIEDVRQAGQSVGVALQRFDAEIERVLRALQTRLKEIATAFSQAFSFEKARERVVSEALAFIERARAEAERATDAIIGEIDRLESLIRGACGEFAGCLDGLHVAALRARHEVHLAYEKAAERMATLERLIQEKSELVDAAANRAMKEGVARVYEFVAATTSGLRRTVPRLEGSLLGVRNIVAEEAKLDDAIAEVARRVAALRATFETMKKATAKDLGALRNGLGGLVDNADVEHLSAKIKEVEERLQAWANGVVKKIVAEDQSTIGYGLGLLGSLRSQLNGLGATIATANKAVQLFDAGHARRTLDAECARLMESLLGEVSQTIVPIRGKAITIVSEFTAAYRELLAKRGGDLLKGVDALHNGIREKINGIVLGTGLDEKFKSAIKEECGQLAKLGEAFTGAKADVENALTRVAKTEQELLKRLQNRAGEIRDAIGTLASIPNSAAEIGAHARAIARSLEAAGGAWRSSLEDGASQMFGAARNAKFPDSVFALADGACTLHRAFGDVPRVEGLDFNRRRIAYHFNQLDRAIRTTPMAGLLDRAGDSLKAMGLRLPTSKLLDGFVPHELKNFDATKLLPDLAGLKLAKLFPNFRLPEGISKYVTCSHTFDPHTRTASVRGVVNVPFPEQNVLDTGMFKVDLLEATLHATTDLRVENGQTHRSINGSISGNWRLTFGGVRLVQFMQTKLSFDESGKIDFDLRPERVKMEGVLGFLSEKLTQFVKDKEGDGVSIIKDRNGLPKGVKVELAVPIPDSQGGTTGIANLELGASFGVALGEAPEFVRDFEINVGFFLSKRNKPFTITAFILGGAGSIEVEAKYLPFAKKLGVTVDGSINASASLAISFAGISGGVYAYLGITFFYQAMTGQRPKLLFGARLLIVGVVDVLGIISARIELELSIQYENGGRLIAIGRLSIRIKICWCFTIRISTQVRIESGGNKQSLRPGKPETFAALRGQYADHLATFC